MALQSNENEEAERELSPSACVPDIRELCRQFQCAIAALASDDIAALETSTQLQEHLVAKLQTWFRVQPTDQPLSQKVSSSSSDFRTLLNVTRTYSSLLQRARRTARLRAALCQTYKQNFPAAPGPAVATGWSCEV